MAVILRGSHAVSERYQAEMVQCLESFCDDGGCRSQLLRDVRMTASSLLFTLLPLHDKENHRPFYDLIFLSPYLGVCR